VSGEDEETIESKREGGEDEPTTLQAAKPSVPLPPVSVPPPTASRPSVSRDAGARPSTARLPSSSRNQATATRATLNALHDDEAARARVFGRVTALLATTALLVTCLPMEYRADPRMRIAGGAAFAALAVAGLWVHLRARTPARYTRGVFRVFAVVALLGAAVLIHFMGVFSYVSAIVVLGLAFFALGEDKLFGIGGTVAIAVVHLVSALLVGTGVIPDLGILPLGDAPWAIRVSTCILIFCLYLAHIWQARGNRRGLTEAIERSHEAARLAHNREAQLQEAKDNLDIALKAAAGGGRYTGTSCGGFVLEEIVGRGAMGEVYAARDAQTGARAAVKLLHAHMIADRDTQKRFLREADIALRLSSPNLVDVKAVGQAPDGAPYIAMELLSGRDLAALLRERATLSLDEAATLIGDATRGLAAAHAQGVVHRDLKPSNLFCAETDGKRATWKILDFGVSKLRGSHGTLTEGHVVGTPGYMPPEQAEGKECDATADVFSLGAVAYRVVTGRRPFAGQDVPQMLFQVVFMQPLRPRDVAPSVPRDVESVLAIALAKQPRDRFASAEEFGEAFVLAAKGKLPEMLRIRADKLLNELPWGAMAEDDRRKRPQRARA
jgi:serine/threonine-protein kinase